MASGSADCGAGVGELDDGGVTAQIGRLVLFLEAGLEEFRAGKFRGGTGPIGGDDPGD